MKFVDVSCPSCGARLEITDVQEFVTCEHCGKQFFVDDEIQRSEQRIDHHYYAEDAENAGYQFEKGRMRARQEAEEEELAREAEAMRRIHTENREGCLKFSFFFIYYPIKFLYWFATTDRLSKKAKLIIAAIILAVWAFNGHNKSKTETYSAESTANMEQEKPISYDALQKMFLRIDDSITPERLQSLLQEDEFQSIVWRKQVANNSYDRYRLAYSKDVVNDVRGAEGDYLTIAFDLSREDRFMYAIYYKQGKYVYAILFRYGHCFSLGSSDPDDQSKWGYYYYSAKLGKGNEPPYITCTDAKDALDKVLKRE